MYYLEKTDFMGIFQEKLKSYFCFKIDLKLSVDADYSHTVLLLQRVCRWLLTIFYISMFIF